MIITIIKPKNILKILLMIIALMLVSVTLHTTFSSYVEPDYGKEEYYFRFEDAIDQDFKENYDSYDQQAEQEFKEINDSDLLYDSDLNESEETEFEIAPEEPLDNGIRGVVVIDASSYGEEDIHIASGVKVRLYDVSTNMTFVEETKTNERGEFFFESLSASYVIRLESDMGELDTEDQEAIPVAYETSGEWIDFSDYEGIAPMYVEIQPFNATVTTLQALRTQINNCSGTSCGGTNVPFVINLNFPNQAITSTATGNGNALNPNQGNTMTVPSGANIVLQSATGRQTWYQHTSGQRHFFVNSGGTLTLNNVVLSRTAAFAGNNTSSGGIGVHGGTLILNAGSEISRNHWQNRGGMLRAGVPSTDFRDWGAGVRVGSASSNPTGITTAIGTQSVGGTLIMNEGSLITQNRATTGSDGGYPVGGGVAVIGRNARFYMNAGTISDNTALYTGRYNWIIGSGGGVGVHYGGTFNLRGGTITRNQSNYGGGIAAGHLASANSCLPRVHINVIVPEDSTVEISHNIAPPFSNINNPGGGFGGGVYVQNANFIMGGLGEKQIINNEGVHGGGVHLTSSSFSTVGRGIFETGTTGIRNISGNRANVGGGVQVTSANGANGAGGRFYMEAGTTIIDNTATTNGGGVLVTNGVNMSPTLASATEAVRIARAPTFIMNDGIIYNNVAGTSGGGVQVYLFGRFNMLGGSIHENTSTTTGGGGVSVSGNGLFSMSNPNTIITRNLALGTTGGGGGVKVWGSGTFTMNNGAIGGTTRAAANRGNNGGGVHVAGSGTFNMNAGSIQNNIATNVAGNSNPSSNGGGVHVAGGTFNMNVGEGSRVIRDNDAINGGGVSMTGGTFNMGAPAGTSNIIHNDATNNGGGVFMNSANAIFTFNNGTIGDNDALNHGGGVYITGGTSFSMSPAATVTRNIIDNTARTGGGVYVDHGTFNLRPNGVVARNRALGPATNVGLDTGAGGEGHGGGIFAARTGNINTIEGTINNNSAVGDGGGIFTEVRRYESILQQGDYGNLTIRATAFTGNTSVAHFPRPANADATFVTERIPYETSHSVRDHVLNNHDINFRGLADILDPEIAKTVFAVTNNGTTGSRVENSVVGIEQHLEYAITITNPNASEAIENFMMIDAIPDYLRVVGAPTPTIVVQSRNATGGLDNVSDVTAAYVNYVGGASAADHTNGEVRVIFPTLSANGEYVITFRVMILNDAAGETITNTARLHRHTVGIPINGQPGAMVDYDPAIVELEEETVSFVFFKTRENGGTTLAGAVFSLYARNAAGTGWGTTPVASGVTSAIGTGTVRFDGLTLGGQYRLVETQAPNGFITPPTGSYWIISVAADGTISLPVSEGRVLDFIFRSGNFFLPNERTTVPLTGILDNDDLYATLVIVTTLVGIVTVYHKISRNRKMS